MAQWRILAVDDDPDILELIEMTLGERYDIQTLDSGVRAFEVIAAFEPDLVILDIMMPQVTGYQIIEKLRDQSDLAALPVIFLSAKDSMRDQRYGYKLGATTYLTKPFQPERLVRNVDNVFEHTPPERQAKRFPLEAARDRVKVIVREDQDLILGDPQAPKVTTKTVPTPRTRTIHHREAEAPDERPWRG